MDFVVVTSILWMYLGPCYTYVVNEYHSHAEYSVFKSSDNVFSPWCVVFEDAMRAKSSA